MSFSEIKTALATVCCSEVRATLAPVKEHPRLIVHLMRHAEAEHKIEDDPSTYEAIRDPRLTARGIEQCRTFETQFKDELKHITHILCSPLTRTIMTALGAFTGAEHYGLKIIALPELQNFDRRPSGRGLDLNKLKETYPEEKYPIDVATYGRKDWNEKDRDKWRFRESEWRVEHIKGLLKGLQVGGKGSLVEVVVVSHGSFLKELFPYAEYKAVELNSCVFIDNDKLGKVEHDEIDAIRRASRNSSIEVQVDLSDQGHPQAPDQIAIQDLFTSAEDVKPPRKKPKSLP